MNDAGWGDEYEDTCPPCPWCGDEITDSVDDVIGAFGDGCVVQCAACGEMVECHERTVVYLKARKA